MPSWRLCAGGLVLIACIQYPIAEIVAASAWRAPPYSFVSNYISDLGSLGCSPQACSPLASVMNGAFVAAGILAIAAAFLLGPLLPDPRWRRCVVALASLHGCGTIGVGLVPSAPHAAAGTPPLHFIAACAAILGGNLALLATARALVRSGAAGWLRVALAGLGLFGLGSAGLLVMTPLLPTGLVERMAADTITPAELLLGGTVLIALRRGWPGTRPEAPLRMSRIISPEPETGGAG